MRVAKIFFCVLLFACTAQAGDIYVSQSGSGDGSACDNARSAAWFNTAGNWGVDAGDISAGDTVHICGTITTNLTVLGSGTDGNKITIIFETDAEIYTTLCGGSGCLNVENKSYIIVNGGTSCGYINQNDVSCNGQIYNSTAIPESSSFAINASGCDDCEFKNLHIGPIIVPNGDDQGSGDFRGIQNLNGTTSGSSFHVHNSFFEYVASAVVYVPGQQNDNGFEVNNIVTENINSSIDISNNNAGTMTRALIYDNHFGSTDVWDATGCPNHHNSLHAFAIAGGNGGTNSGIDYYNNIVDGSWGSCSTSALFIEGGSDGSNRNIRAWNNLFIITYTVLNNGMVSFNGDGSLKFYNNTIVGTNESGDVGFFSGGVGTNTLDFRNNIVSGFNTLIAVENILLGDFDYNLYGGNSSNPWYDGDGPTWYPSLASWRTACSCDAASNFGSSGAYVDLSAGYPNITSPAIDNASSTDIDAIFTTDIIGKNRYIWDIGAYEYCTQKTISIGTKTISVGTKTIEVQ